jgi:ABC-type polysaccharide/polyol phosphate export permease
MSMDSPLQAGDEPLEPNSHAQPDAALDEADVVREPPAFGVLADLGHDVWRSRELLAQLTLRDIRIRYTQAVMGLGWAVLMPMLILGAGLLVRFAMAHVAGDRITAPEVLGIAVKAVPWAFFVGALSFATTSLSGNFQLVTKVAFPRIVLPVSSVLVQTFDTAIGSTALLAVALLLGANVAWSWLWLGPLTLIVILITAGTCIFVASANVFFRDVKYLVQVFLTFGIFFTPVFYEPEMLGTTGSWLVMVNPLSPVLEGLRLCMAHGHNLAEPLVIGAGPHAGIVVWTPWYLVYAASVGVLGFFGSALLFRRLEHLFAEYA